MIILDKDKTIVDIGNKNLSVSSLNVFFNDDLGVNVLEDDYSIPNFEELEEKLIEDPIFKDFPSRGSLRVGFYHMVQGKRKWDKVYYVTKNKIEEGNLYADINVWISSDYVEDLVIDFCKGIQKATNERNFGKALSIKKVKFLWRYSGLIKYRDCFGKEGLNNLENFGVFILAVLIILFLLLVILLSNFLKKRKS